MSRGWYAMERDGNQVAHGSDSVQGWVYRFGTKAERDDFVTLDSWHTWALASTDFRVRWARDIGKWTGWPCRVDAVTKSLIDYNRGAKTRSEP